MSGDYWFRKHHELHEKYDKLLGVINQIHSQKGDDHCWMDIDLIFKAVGLPVPDRKVGDKEAMKANCCRYIDTMCAGGEWPTYQELLDENKRLKEELAWKNYK